MTPLDGELGRGANADSTRQRTRWIVALWVALAGWTAAIGLTPANAVVAHQDLADLARNLASGMFLVAGVLCLAAWRITASPVTARRAIAFLVLGAGVPGAAAIGPLLREPVPLAHNAPSTKALFLVVVVAFLLPGQAWSRQSHRHPIPSGYLGGVAVLVGACLAGLLCARQLVPADRLPATWRMIVGAALIAWLVLAYRAAGEALATPLPVRWSPAGAYVLLAIAELVRLMAMDGGRTLVGVGPGFQLAAAGSLVAVAVGNLKAAYGGEEEHAADLTRENGDLQRHLAAIERAERERLHDARTALVSVIGASELLDTSGVDVDQDRLRHLIRAELRRLQGMLDAGRVEAVGEFDLASALRPVIQMHQVDGHEITVEIVPIRVVGRAVAAATVLDNLLRNAARHAPGARVWVSVERAGCSARLLVEDDGPGIPDEERARVVLAGVRGSTARGVGEGLGLSSSLRAMTGQGGALRVEQRSGGGTGWS